jgi:hypothetical protein
MAGRADRARPWAAGLDKANRWVGSLQFFLYDVIKITILFVHADLRHQLYPKLLSAGTEQADSRQVPRIWANCVAALWERSRRLLLLVHPAVYRVHLRRAAGRRDVFIFDLVADGGPRLPAAAS